MNVMRWTRLALLAGAGLLAGCGSLPTGTRGPLACDDGIKAAFKPDALTTVVEVRAIAKGTALVAVDSAQPITMVRDVCLVKLLVGPGVTAEKDKNARSYSEGIGIEVWLPAHGQWNERIRNYGGGGWVGGGHRHAGQIGSKVPALVNANMGYASATTDAGQPFYQDPSFTFLSNGQVNVEAFRDLTARALFEQAVKTRELTQLYYGSRPKYVYYDGHSQGGRQGLKVAQERPELYDGYLVAQPAIYVPKFGLAAFWPQVVTKSELGFNATDKGAATAFARKVDAATARAVASCDKERLGFLLDPASCSYDPGHDAGALCTGVAGRGVMGSGSDPAACMSLKEADALMKIWNGPVGTDGKQLWWSLPRGSAYGGQITQASTDFLALALGDVSYSADAASAAGVPAVNTSTLRRNRWTEVSYAGYADAFRRMDTLPYLRDYMTDNADLRKLRDQGGKMILWNGLAEDVIPPTGALYYYEAVVARMGGVDEVQKFFRMYNIPGTAHSSQGRAYTVAGNNGTVPLPMLPGNANQNPAPQQDQMFSTLVEWVERGTAPGEVVITSRDGGTSYPICVHPKKITWIGSGSAKAAANYRCA